MEGLRGCVAVAGAMMHAVISSCYLVYTHLRQGSPVVLPANSSLFLESTI